MKNYILLAISILAGGMAFFLAMIQLKQARAELQTRYKQRPAIVFVRDMVEGEEIKKEDLKAKDFFVQGMSSDVVPVDDYAMIVDRKLARPVMAGVAITYNDVKMPGVMGTGSALARLVREKERAVSISVDSVSSVSSLVQPNDRVDILATFRFPSDRGDQALDTVTLTLLQNVTVLATGQNVPTADRGQRGNSRGSGYSQVTLAVNPKEAELLVFAQQKGKLYLTLRSPEDPFTESKLQDVNFNYLKDHVKEYQDDRDARQQQLIGP